MSDLILTPKINGGAYLDDVIKEGIALAEKTGVYVDLRFNGASILVDEKCNLHEVRKGYFKYLRKARDRS